MNERIAAGNGLSEIFSRKQKAAQIGAAPMQRRIEADAAERAALAKVFGLRAISALAGDYSLAATPGGMIEATLKLAAAVTQICVLSLEPFEARITETARLRFIPDHLSEASEADLNLESLEDPDELAFSGDVIDLGAALAEQLALALDPYPRKPGAELPAGSGTEANNPFSALALRKSRPANDEE